MTDPNKSVFLCLLFAVFFFTEVQAHKSIVVRKYCIDTLLFRLNDSTTFHTLVFYAWFDRFVFKYPDIIKHSILNLIAKILLI